MGYQYIWADLDCKCCLDKKSRRCHTRLCPHIMAFLPELINDYHFRAAIKDAEHCKTAHRKTLLYLNDDAQRRNFDQFYEEPVYRCNFNPECALCNMGSHGFICFDEKDGSCLIDWASRTNHTIPRDTLFHA